MSNRVAKADGTTPPALDSLDVVVAHWGINAWGGAEYLVTNLAETVGAEKVYTLGKPAPTDPNPYGDVQFVDVTSDLSLAPIRRLQARIGRVFEYALWEDVDWRKYGQDVAPDVLITSGATARAVITPAETLHVNYCHSPPRWFYDLYHDRKDSLTGMLGRPLLRHLRTRDVAVDPRVDHYFANSPVVARRIWKYYKRDAEVLYPPVDLEAYRDDGDGGYYLHLGRLDHEKGVPAVVEGFAGTDRELVLAGGKGDAADAVLEEVHHHANIDYRGFVSEAEKVDLLANCRALIFNARSEDFGIVPIEALASGKPVLARNEGFPARVVEPGETGYLHNGSPTDIHGAIKRFEREEITGKPREGAGEFSRAAFAERLADSVDEAYRAFEARF